MGTDPCNLLEVELALDRVDAQLAKELPDHMRAFALAYVSGTPMPAAPDAVGRVSSIAIGKRALVHPVLADRGLALLRLVAPTVIERDPGVATARAATPSWDALAMLAAARDTAARHRFGKSAVEVLHVLAGADAAHETAVVPAPIAAWSERDRELDASAIDEVWQRLADRHGASGRVWLKRGDVRPRAFVVVPRREVIVAVPRVIATPAARFAVLHELGHAIANLVAPAGLPRTVDEAVASYVARSMEQPDVLPAPWFSAEASEARVRRTALARFLDAIERALPALPPSSTEGPAWALWHDPGSQASYVAAEAIADRWWSTLGPAPAKGALAAAIAVERERIDRTTTL